MVNHKKGETHIQNRGNLQLQEKVRGLKSKEKSK